MIDFSEYEFRCHYLSELMANPKGTPPAEKIIALKAEIEVLTNELKLAKAMGKSELKTNIAKQVKLSTAEQDIIALEKKKDDPGALLGETAKKRLLRIFIKSKYGRDKELRSRYIEKGLVTEEDGITNIALATKKFLFKNEILFRNGFICGTPDIIEGDALPYTDVHDNKSSWDIHTFAVHKYNEDKDEIDNGYWWQLQGYGILTGAPMLHLWYNLINTPEPLILAAIKKAWYEMGQPEENDSGYILVESIIRKEMTFDDIPLPERQHKITFETDFELEKRIEKRVLICRDYMKERFS